MFCIVSLYLQTPKLANEFKQVFEECQQKLKEAENSEQEGKVLLITSLGIRPYHR
jgi:hypothetical protein